MVFGRRYERVHDLNAEVIACIVYAYRQRRVRLTTEFILTKIVGKPSGGHLTTKVA